MNCFPTAARGGKAAPPARGAPAAKVGAAGDL